MTGMDDKFYTVRGYELRHGETNVLSSSMEDYLEMVYRLCQSKGYTRTGDLAQALNVQPSSASAMVHKLSAKGYIQCHKYGTIELTERGKELGSYLLDRHTVIADFLGLIGVSAGLLAETEKIEHNVSYETVERIRQLVMYFKANPQVLQAYRAYLDQTF
jgi:DtxR family Mn-dependent transcriptional regulator